jgi:hypothetical protein
MKQLSQKIFFAILFFGVYGVSLAAPTSTIVQNLTITGIKPTVGTSTLVIDSTGHITTSTAPGGGVGGSGGVATSGSPLAGQFSVFSDPNTLTGYSKLTYTDTTGVLTITATTTHTGNFNTIGVASSSEHRTPSSTAIKITFTNASGTNFDATGYIKLNGIPVLTTSTGLSVLNFASANISQWTNNSNYVTQSTQLQYATTSVAAVWTTLQEFSGAGASTTQLWSASTSVDFANALVLASGSKKLVAYTQQTCAAGSFVTSFSARGNLTCTGAMATATPIFGDGVAFFIGGNSSGTVQTNAGLTFVSSTGNFSAPTGTFIGMVSSTQLLTPSGTIQTLYVPTSLTGGIASGDDLTMISTGNSTKGSFSMDSDLNDPIAGTSKYKVTDNRSAGNMQLSFNDNTFAPGQGWLVVSNGTITGFVGHTNTNQGFTFGPTSNHPMTIRTYGNDGAIQVQQNGLTIFKKNSTDVYPTALAQVDIRPQSASTTGLNIQGIASQNVDLFDITDSTPTKLFSVASSGAVYAKNIMIGANNYPSSTVHASGTIRAGINGNSPGCFAWNQNGTSTLFYLAATTSTTNGVGFLVGATTTVPTNCGS